MRRNYNNISPSVILSAGVDAVETTLTFPSTAGFPPVPFTVAIERGTANEEACLVTAKDATTLTVERGYDGTSAVPHGFGSRVDHTTIAMDYREAGIVRIDQTERDALADEDLWEGRVIYNEDSKRIEVAGPGGVWDQILPTGAVLPFGGGTVPAGFLLCDGQAVSRATYAGLFGVIGTTFGAGDGSTTFEVPDLRQRFPLGKAASGTGATLGETGGAIDHTHSQPSHSHTGPSHAHSTPSTGTDGSHAHSAGNTGSGGSHAHSNPSTGAASVGSALGSNSSSGLVSRDDITHSHGSHSHSGGYTDPAAYTGSSLGHTHTISGEGHSHSVGSATPSTYTAPDQSHGHIHGTYNTASGGSHAHSTPNTGSAGSHSHTLGNTGSSGTGSTGSDGGDTTGSNNPPFIALNFIIRV